MTKRRKRVEISEAVIQPTKPTNKGLVAFISFVYNNELKINDCQIISRPQGGFRVLYPIRELFNGSKISTVYPITKEIGEQLEEKLLQEYENFLSKFQLKK
ncbi:MAG TPA: septation protein SpoVG family protein [Candidatus Lokiarchaeia archaeon]